LERRVEGVVGICNKKPHTKKKHTTIPYIYTPTTYLKPIHPYSIS